MSEKIPSDVKLDENADGTVSFATEVVATIAGLAANEVEGVASMPSSSGGIAEKFSRKSSRNFSKGVRVDIEDNKVAVDVTIIVEYGSPVPDVALNIQENIKKAIETMSGLDVRSVDVHVQGVSFERENRAAAELEEHQQKMLEQEAARKEEEKREATEPEKAAPAAPVEAPEEKPMPEEAPVPEAEAPAAEAEDDEGEYELELEDVSEEEIAAEMAALKEEAEQP